MRTKSIKKNYIYNLIYQITTLIIPVIVTPYISRVLQPEGVGQYSFAHSLISYFVLFGALGFGYYAQREIAKYQDDIKEQSKIFWEINICRLMPVIISLLLNFVFIISGIYKDSTLLMMLLSINIISVSVDITFFFQGNEEFGKIVSKNVIIKILGTISIFLFVKEQNDVWLYSLLNSLALVVSNLVLWPYLFKKIKKVNIKELKPLRHLKGTIRLFIPTIAISIYTMLDKSLIGIITQSSSENGYYEQSEKIAKVAMTIVTSLGTVMIPRNTHEIAIGNMDKVKRNIYNACHFVWLVGLPMTFGMITIASNLVPWFLGEGFEKSIILLQIFSVLILIIGISNVLGLQYLLPMKKDGKFTLSLISGSIINLLLNTFLIFYLKSVGAAIATIIAEIMVTTIMLVVVRKELSIKEIFKSMVKPLVSAFIMFFIVNLVSKNLESSFLNTFFLFIIGFSIYSFVIVLLKDKLVFSVLSKVKSKIIKA